MKKTLGLIITFLFLMPGLAQDLKPDKIALPYTTKSEREKFKVKLQTEIIEANLKLTLSDSTERNWKSAFWGAQLSLTKSELVKNSLLTALNKWKERSDEFVRSSVEAAYTLFPVEFEEEVKNIFLSTFNEKNFAMCANYLLKGFPGDFSIETIMEQMQKRFPNYKNHPILYSLTTRLGIPAFQPNEYVPKVLDLFNYRFWNDKTVIFSIQRINRDYCGIAVIRQPNGEFVKNIDGSFFSVPQLARSISNLPGYLTNGNTPQGMFSIQGIDTSKNYYIGPTPNIQTRLPYEAEAIEYFHNQVTDTVWSIDLYKNLLPESWRDYKPIFEAYYAGKAGRNEIIVHGTTIDTSFYKGQTYAPNTPSLGCLCSLELWSEVDGNRELSYQQQLIDAYSKVATGNDFFIVVELDNQDKNVELSDIEHILK
jgi:hypothetical protein